MTGLLDEERKKAVEEYIQQNKEVQNDIQKIQNGMNYLDILAQTKVSEALLEKVKQPSSALDNLLLKMKFQEWSPGFRLGIEASLVAIGVVIVALVLPWQRIFDFKIQTSDLVLSEITKKFESKNPAEAEISSKEESSDKADISFPDEVAGAAAVVAAQSTTTSTTSTTVRAIAQNPVAPAAGVASATAVTTTSTTIPAVAAETKRVGYLYRGTIGITNAKAATAKLVEKLNSLGARKAGNVELGWSKGPGSYFHFTMPESGYQEMTAAFQEYGALSIAKERHERVMPEGIVRVIITVDEKK